MKKLALVGITAVSLAGCGQLFGGVESPHRKPGLWEQTLVGDRVPQPIVTKWCFDAASDRQIPVLGRRQRKPGGGGGGGPAAACSKMSLTKSGDTYTSDSQCSFGGATITNHSVTTGDYDSKYTTTTSIDAEGASDPARNGKHIITITWVYKGDCPAELAPGQVERPDGEVVEMAAMRNGMGGFGRGGRGGASNATASNTASNSTASN